MHKVNQIVFKLKDYKQSKKDVYKDIIKQIELLINNGDACVIFKDNDTDSIALDFMNVEDNSSDPVPYYLTKDEAMVVEDYIMEKEAALAERQTLEELLEDKGTNKDRRA